MKPLPSLTSDEIISLRPPAHRPDTDDLPLEVSWEQEFTPDPPCKKADVLTVMLRGGECSFKCLMCDLWKYTHPGATPQNAISSQLTTALSQNALNSRRNDAQSERPRWIKLYNASNFFAPTNVPSAELTEIAQQLNGFSRVVVENHPTIRTRKILDFQLQLSGQLEVAMGLETVHPQTLAALNKQMTLDDFQKACEWLRGHGIDVRAFILLRPPGMSEAEGIDWCLKAIEFANTNGVRHASIIPVRGGNGALEFLEGRGLFEAPMASSLEAVLSQVEYSNMVVTADLWDWSQLRGTCHHCSQQRHQQLNNANLTQNRFIPIRCSCEQSSVNGRLL